MDKELYTGNDSRSFRAYINEFNWKWWTNPHEIDKNTVLEEVVDIIHFLLSAYIQMDIPPEQIGSLRELWERTSLMDESAIIETLVNLLHTLTEIHSGRFGVLKQSDVLWGPLLGVVKSVGFSYGDLFWAYTRKNYENRRRQLDKNFKGGSYYACKKS